jgi:hypothetical protein
MSTSDGITTDDWEHVKELAIAVLDASDDPAQWSIRRGEMLSYLSELEKKYGPKPSILATRADFVDDITLQEELLRQAFELARSLDDQCNVLLVVHSLAKLYIETLMDPAEGHLWLDRLRAELRTLHDPSYDREAVLLGEKLQALLGT